MIKYCEKKGTFVHLVQRNIPMGKRPFKRPRKRPNGKQRGSNGTGRRFVNLERRAYQLFSSIIQDENKGQVLTHVYYFK